MKIITSLIALGLVLFGATPAFADEPPTPEPTASEKPVSTAPPAPSKTTVDQPRPTVQRPAAPSYFTIAVVPDTQFAAAHYPEILQAQMGWLRDHADDQHIAMMLQEGDIVNTMTSDAEWAVAKEAYSYLDGVVPMVFAAGNHDVQDYIAAAKQSSTDSLTTSAAHDFEHFAETHQLPSSLYYPTQVTRYTSFLDSFEHYKIDGRYSPDNMANTYTLLDVKGDKYLVLSLQFGAPGPVLSWAKTVAHEHADRTVIVLTHDYLSQVSQIRGAPGNTGENSLPKSLDPSLSNPYKMWTNLVKASPNIRFVFSGHVNSKTPGKPYAVGQLKSATAGGQYAYQMLANYQMYGQGGNGYLRLIRVYPDTGRVEVRTYSPWLDRYLTGAKDQFTYSNVNL